MQVTATVEKVSGLCQSVSQWLQLELLEKHSGPIAEQIALTVFGSRKTRLGAGPTPEQVAFMVQRIEEFVKLGYPIEMFCFWGAVKNYGVDDTRWSADIMDAFGIRRYATLAAQVRSIYAPGLVVRLINQDLDELLLTNRPEDLNLQVREYSTSLSTLANAIRPEQDVGFVSEAEMLAAVGITGQQYLGQVRHFAHYLYNYIWASDRLPPETWAQSPEYLTMVAETGWQGLISQEQRNYYSKQIEHAYPLKTASERLWMLSQYLAGSLARRKSGAFGGTFGLPAINASFVPHAPGTPRNLAMGRVEYKVKDSKSSNAVRSPWNGFGAIEVNDGKCIRVTLIDKETPYEPYQINIDSATIRADLVVTTNES